MPTLSQSINALRKPLAAAVVWLLFTVLLGPLELWIERTAKWLHQAAGDPLESIWTAGVILLFLTTLVTTAWFDFEIIEGGKESHGIIKRGFRIGVPPVLIALSVGSYMILQPSPVTASHDATLAAPTSVKGQDPPDPSMVRITSSLGSGQAPSATDPAKLEAVHTLEAVVAAVSLLYALWIKYELATAAQARR